MPNAGLNVLKHHLLLRLYYKQCIATLPSYFQEVYEAMNMLVDTDLNSEVSVTTLLSYDCTDKQHQTCLSCESSLPNAGRLQFLNALGMLLVWILEPHFPSGLPWHSRSWSSEMYLTCRA